MLVFALLVALSGQSVQDEPTTVAPVMVEPLKKRPSPTLTDHQIVMQLNDLHRTQPDRVVCVKVRRSMSLIPRTECATLAQWYSLETSRDTKDVVRRLLGDESGSGPPDFGPPDELVTVIKDGIKARAMSDAEKRRRAEAH